MKWWPCPGCSVSLTEIVLASHLDVEGKTHGKLPEDSSRGSVSTGWREPEDDLLARVPYDLHTLTQADGKSPFLLLLRIQYLHHPPPIAHPTSNRHPGNGCVSVRCI